MNLYLLSLLFFWRDVLQDTSFFSLIGPHTESNIDFNPLLRFQANVAPIEELVRAMEQLDVAHREETQKKVAEREKVVADGEQQAQYLAEEKQRIQDLVSELERELIEGDGEMKTMEKKLKQLKSVKEDLDEEDASIAKVLKEQELETVKVEEQLAEQRKELERKEENSREMERVFNQQIAQEREEVEKIKKQVEELEKLEMQLKKTKATEEDELLDIKNNIKDKVATNDALAEEVKQLEVKVSDISQGKPTAVVLEEMKTQFAEAEMAIKVAESQGAAMDMVEKEKEELVKINTAYREEIEKITEESKGNDVKLTELKKTLCYVKEQVVLVLEKQKKEEEYILEQEKQAQEYEKCLENGERRFCEAQLKVKNLEKEIKEEEQKSSALKLKLEAKAKEREVEFEKNIKVSGEIQDVCNKVTEMRAIKEELLNGLKELAVERANGEQVLVNLKLNQEEVSAQLIAVDCTNRDLEVKVIEEMENLKQERENSKQVEESLQLKELERAKKEKIFTALEAAVKEKEEELQDVVKQTECLGKEVAPIEGEAEQVKQQNLYVVD